MTSRRETDLVDDLFLPTLMFAALGGMTWAVRGCSGFGATAGCIFAGVVWGVAWWFVSQQRGGEAPRRYASGWVVLALAVGVGISGARGWMQWPSFFEGRLQTNASTGDFVPIDRSYGFLWLFIAGVPWAGVGACLLAWCGSRRETRAWHWAARIACGIGAAFVAGWLYNEYPQLFLPLYESLADRYKNFDDNPALRRLVNDSRSAITHLGLYLGLLGFEVARREGKNVVLIATVGLLNGVGWSLLQNWTWARQAWPGSDFNYWRCWESSGGISIGIAVGVAYFFVNRPMSTGERAELEARPALEGPTIEWLAAYSGVTALLALVLAMTAGSWGVLYAAFALAFGPLYWLLRKDEPRAPANALVGDPTLERMGLYLGALFGVGLSLRNGLKGWFNIYRGNEEYYSGVLWQIFGPLLLIPLLVIFWQALFRPDSAGGASWRRRTWLVWLTLLLANGISLLVTGPLSNWSEFVFAAYYGLLFLITVVIVLYYSRVEPTCPAKTPAAG